MYHTVHWNEHATKMNMAVDVMMLFTDRDGDKLTYKATSKSSAVKIMEINSMNRTIVVDVVRLDGASFPIVVEASDGHGTVSAELDVYTTNPIPDTDYKIRQLPDKKKFAPVMVYERHAKHTATFAALMDSTNTKLGFATAAIAAKPPKYYTALATEDYPDHGGSSDSKAYRLGRRHQHK